MKIITQLKCATGLIILLPFMILADNSFGDTAQVMPKGNHRVELQNKFWFPITQAYDSHGEKRDLGSFYSTSLDSNGIAALAAIEEATGMPPGSASLGRTDVDMTMHYNDLILYYQYGVTDKLTIGTEIPFYWQWTDVERATVNTESATIGINPNSQGPPLLPLDAGGVASGDLAMEMLQGQLEELGYQRIENWSDNGFGDILAGFRYQYLEQSPYRLALTGGITLPTGRVDDPDSFVDIEFGYGAWGFFINSNNDYTGITDLTLNATFRYDHYLTSSQDRRIPESPTAFISSRKESVDIQLGDKFELEFAGSYNLSEAFSVEAMYRYAYQCDEVITGTTDFDYSLLAQDTFKEEQVARFGLSYSTLPAFARGNFPLPLTATLEYRDRFTGKNVMVSRYIRLKLAIFF